jgi:hypothetical protein
MLVAAVLSRPSKCVVILTVSMLSLSVPLVVSICWRLGMYLKLSLQTALTNLSLPLRHHRMKGTAPHPQAVGRHAPSVQARHSTITAVSARDESVHMFVLAHSRCTCFAIAKDCLRASVRGDAWRCRPSECSQLRHLCPESGAINHSPLCIHRLLPLSRIGDVTAAHKTLVVSSAA